MSKAEGGDKPAQIQLSALSLPELAQIKQELEQDVNGIQDSLQTLYKCKAKYAISKEVLESFQSNWKDRQILVPLTSSMYVPGRIKDMDKFVIDIGTGYYVEKNLIDTKDYFKRRIDYVQEQIENIEKIHMQKNQFLTAVNSIIEMKQANASKLLAQQQQQKSQHSSLAQAQTV